MAINFPDPSQQTTYVADSGVTYEFIDGVWKATTFAGLGDVRYVNSTGDDMSGNLTIATDKIALNTDGSASFAGTVDANALTIDGAAVDTSAEVDAKVATKTTEAYVNQQIAAIPPTDLSAYDTSAEVTAKVSALETSLTDGAPGALDTLNELAASLGDDSNFAGTVTNSLAGKADLSGATFTGDVTASAFIGDGSQLTGVGSETIISSTPPTPADYEVGTMWWNSDSTDTSLYILYQDPTGPNGLAGDKYWVEAAPAPDSIGFDGTHTGDSTFTGNMNVTGSASFAGGDVVITGSGNVKSGDVDNSAGAVLSPVGQNFTRQDGAGSSVAAYMVLNGGLTAADAVARINYDGSASFADYVTSNEGFYVAQTAAPNGSSIFKSWLGSSTYVDILDNGTAEFAGYVKAATNLICDTTSSSNGLYIGDFTNGNYNATIFGNGNATFAGVVVADTGFQSNAYSGRSVGITTTTQGVERALAVEDGSGGYSASLNMDGSAKLAGGKLYVDHGGGFYLGLTDTLDQAPYSTRNISLNVDGSAEFAETVQVGDYTNGGNAGLLLYANGSAVYNNDVVIGGTGASRNIQLKADGSAEFASKIQSGGDPNSGTARGTSINEFGTIRAAQNSGTSSVFEGYTVGTSSPTSLIKADGSAMFAGNITAGNVSDIKFKENIEAAPSQLSDISAFKLKTFDWKDEAPLSDELKAQRKLGLIAQEVEAICPEMVYEVAGQDDDSYKAINHDVLIMKLLGAVKELAAEVAALKAS
jgi:hypothetical protein